MKTLCSILAVLALLIGLSSTVQAQTITEGPLPATAKFVWQVPANVFTVADALTFEPRLYLDSQPATALTQVTCTLNTSVITCQSLTTQSNRDAVNQVGKHILQLSLFRADVGEGVKSDPLAFPSKPGAPTGLRVSP
jgi:hypothetical protein